MCFFNSMSAKAVKLAARYGRKLDIIEAWKEIMSEKEPDHIKNLKELYQFRLAEGMYNIPAYSEPHCVIVNGSDQLQIMDWGLIPRTAKQEAKERYNAKNWHKNARAEEIFEKWPWRNLIRKKRCLIPSTGYYEYHYGPDKKTQPYFIHLTNREVFSMAGLWDEWDDPDTGERLQTFVQITTAANPLARKVHNGGQNPYRMPLIFDEKDEQKWLDPELSDDEIKELLKVYPDTFMSSYPVSKRFKDNDPYRKETINEDKDSEQGKLEF